MRIPLLKATSQTGNAVEGNDGNDANGRERRQPGRALGGFSGRKEFHTGAEIDSNSAIGNRPINRATNPNNVVPILNFATRGKNKVNAEKTMTKVNSATCGKISNSTRGRKPNESGYSWDHVKPSRNR